MVEHVRGCAARGDEGEERLCGVQCVGLHCFNNRHRLKGLAPGVCVGGIEARGRDREKMHRRKHGVKSASVSRQTEEEKEKVVA